MRTLSYPTGAALLAGALLAAWVRADVDLGHIAFAMDTEMAISPLPGEIHDIAWLLDAHRLERFGLSPEWQSDVFMLQRSVEFLYPKRLDNDARYRLRHRQHADLPCAIVDRRHEIVLHDCSPD
jgi:hypothetical protein